MKKEEIIKRHINMTNFIRWCVSVSICRDINLDTIRKNKMINLQVGF